jgi:hypothetical protein
MEDDGYSPLTNDEASDLSEELDFLTKNVVLSALDIRLGQSCISHMQKAIRRQQKK